MNFRPANGTRVRLSEEPGDLGTVVNNHTEPSVAMDDFGGGIEVRPDKPELHYGHSIVTYHSYQSLVLA